MSPRHIKPVNIIFNFYFYASKSLLPAAVKSISPYFFPWMRMPPTRTGISLQHLKMTCRMITLVAYLISGLRTANLCWVVEITQAGIGKAHCGDSGDGQKCVGPQRNFPRLLSQPHFYLGGSEWISRMEASLLLSLLFQRLNNNQTVSVLSTSRTLWILAERISAPSNCL